MGAKSRRKGADGERELVSKLRDLFGIAVDRRLGQARDSGNDVHVGPFAIECKRRAQAEFLYAAMRQCKEGCEQRIPVVALRADGERWLAVMDLEDWAMLARGEL